MGFPATLNAEAPPLHMDADGVVRIAGTRVALDTGDRAYQDGATAEEIVQSYDALDLAMSTWSSATTFAIARRWRSICHGGARRQNKYDERSTRSNLRGSAGAAAGPAG